MPSGRNSSGPSRPVPARYERLHNQILRSVYLAEPMASEVTLQRLHFRLTNLGSDQCDMVELTKAVDDLVARDLLRRDGDTISAPRQ